jgi:hypothetical protein
MHGCPWDKDDCSERCNPQQTHERFMTGYVRATSTETTRRDERDERRKSNDSLCLYHL